MTTPTLGGVQLTLLDEPPPAAAGEFLDEFPDARPCPVCASRVVQAAGTCSRRDRFPAMYLNRLGAWVCWPCMCARYARTTTPAPLIDIREDDTR